MDAEQITIINYQVIPDGENIRCDLVYSDNSTHSFMHKETFRQPGTPVIETIVGICDDSLIGKVKADTQIGY